MHFSYIHNYFSIQGEVVLSLPHALLRTSQNTWFCGFSVFVFLGYFFVCWFVLIFK